MDVLRTPEARFAALPDFDFEPRYTEVDGLRMAHVEAGPVAAPSCSCCTASRPGAISTAT